MNVSFVLKNHMSHSHKNVSNWKETEVLVKIKICQLSWWLCFKKCSCVKEKEGENTSVSCLNTGEDVCGSFIKRKRKKSKFQILLRHNLTSEYLTWHIRISKNSMDPKLYLQRFMIWKNLIRLSLQFAQRLCELEKVKLEKLAGLL